MVGMTGRAGEEMEGRGALFVPYLSTFPSHFSLVLLSLIPSCISLPLSCPLSHYLLVSLVPSMIIIYLYLCTTVSSSELALFLWLWSIHL